jgi:hypothetical protein
MLSLMARVLTQTIEKEFGRDHLHNLLRRGFSGESRFPATGWGDDIGLDRLFSLMQAECAIDGDRFIKAMAREYMQEIRRHWSAWLGLAYNSADFLRLQSGMHLIVSCSIRDQVRRENMRSRFRVHEFGNEMELLYESPPVMCDFCQAMVSELFLYYGDTGTVTHQSCQKKGDIQCITKIKFLSLNRPSNPDLLRPEWKNIETVFLK